MRAPTQCLLLLLLVSSQGVLAAAAGEQSVVRLADYLASLNLHGQQIIFSSALVSEDLTLTTDPGPNPTAAELADLLLPFGLTIRPGPDNSLLVVHIDNAVPPEVTTPVRAEPAEQPLAEIIVTSSLRRLDYARPGNRMYFDRDLATRVPAAAEEAVRLPNRLPGLASGGISARSYIRGGEANETLFLLDGLRLYEPFHLKDFQRVATTINSNALFGMDFYAGAFPARYGDRMSGVMEMHLREPEKDMETELAVSFFNASLLSLGQFGAGGEGDWLVAARRGNLDLIVDVVDPEFGSPDYKDYIGHVAWEFGPLADLGFNFLYSVDKIDLSDVERGEQAMARYENQVYWVNWEATWTENLQSQTIFSFTDIDDSRAGSVDQPGIVQGALDGIRDFRGTGIKQDWTYTAAPHWLVNFGFDGKHVDGRYVFFSTKSVIAPFDTILQNAPLTVYDYNLIIDGAQYAAYAEARWRISDEYAVDLGYRWDYQNYTTVESDSQSSPRVSILYEPSRRTSVRVGWGQYSQSQEVNELQVSDGNDEFYPAQRSEHLVINLRHQFDRDINLDLSLFRKSFRAVRPRYENAFDELTLVPELQFDRFMINADNAESRGVEVLVSHGSATDDVLWWIGYTWSKVDDTLSTEQRPRAWDQTHDVKFGASWQWKRWDFSLAGEIHTGWPTTALTGETVATPGGGEELVLSTSPLYSERFDYFHSLDVRVSRNFEVPRGDLLLFLEITNILNNANPCCTEYSLVDDPGGATQLASRTTNWLPLVPSLGVVWTF